MRTQAIEELAPVKVARKSAETVSATHSADAAEDKGATDAEPDANEAETRDEAAEKVEAKDEKPKRRPYPEKVDGTVRCKCF